MLALIDMVEQIRRFDTDAVGFGAVVTLTLLNVPEEIYRILPLITILAALGNVRGHVAVVGTGDRAGGGAVGAGQSCRRRFWWRSPSAGSGSRS